MPKLFSIEFEMRHLHIFYNEKPSITVCGNDSIIRSQRWQHKNHWRHESRRRKCIILSSLLSSLSFSREIFPRVVPCFPSLRISLGEKRASSTLVSQDEFYSREELLFVKKIAPTYRINSPRDNTQIRQYICEA